MKTAGIVYGTESGIVRYVVVPGEGSNTLNNLKPQAGMTLALYDYEGDFYLKQDEIEKVVENIRGKKADDSRCVVVNAKGEVIAAMSADPILDKADIESKGLSLVQSKDAAVGWLTDENTGELKDPFAGIDPELVKK